ncbi:MAG: hypothetical protein WCP52_09120 [Bacteroidota bacterium]
MKIKNIILQLALSVLVSLTFTSCKKSDRDRDTDLSAAKDNALTENVVAGIFKTIGEFTDSTWQLRSSTCAAVSITPADTFTFPKTLTIDFDTINCLCSDGNLRRGKIIATFYGKFRDSLTIISVAVQNFAFNNNGIQSGTYSITNNGRNTAGLLTFGVNIQNAYVYTNIGSIGFSGRYVYQWTTGETTTTNPFDDVYSITGSSSGRSISGNTFTSSIVNPLTIALNCAYIEKGMFSITPANLSTRTVDFGAGNCDQSATITINGVNYDFNQ